MKLVAFLLLAQPDFTGYWSYNAERSKAQGKLEKLYLAIDQRDGRHRQRIIALNNGREERAEFNYAVEGESRNSLRGLALNSQSSWEGDVFVVASTARLPNGMEMKVTERLSLSSDRKVLTMERSQAMPGRQVNETIVFDANPESAAEFTKPERTASQQYKNLQVLGSIPSSQLIPKML